MKSTIVILVLLIALVTFGWWKRDQSANTEVTAAQAEMTTLSNRLSTNAMKLNHQDQMVAVLQGKLEERAKEIGSISNALVRTKAELAKSQSETSAIRGQVQAGTQRAGDLDGQRAKLASEVERLTAEAAALRIDADAARAGLADSERWRASLRNDLERERAEKAELAEQLNDPAALRARARSIPSGPHRPTGKEMAGRLVLQSDGSVSTFTPKPEQQ